jgi:magnesium-protoporphyrin IX monomethyl ester (oxidative) cyclase
MCPPIGLAYLAATLKNAGFEVRILDMVAEAPDTFWPYRDTHLAFGLTDQDLLARLAQFNPNMVGIGGFTSQFGRIKQIIAAVKSWKSDVPVVLGGAVASTLPEYALRNTKADFVIHGEGELPLLKLAQAIEAGQTASFASIDALGYKTNGQLIVNPNVCFHKDINTIAWPARELLDHQTYIADGVAMPVITSRSCPCNCTFCNVHLVSGRRWRPRDPLDVADEIEDLVKRWGYKTVSIFDDAANVRPERLITICQEVVRRALGIRLTFPSSLIIRYITKDLLYWMKQAGAIGLSLPIEHANDFMRNQVIRKNLDLDLVDQVMDWCRQLQLLTVGNFVVGMPGETKHTLQELLDYVKTRGSRLDMVSVYFATPFPGTHFYNECLQKGYLTNPEKNEFLDFDTYSLQIKTPDLSAETLLYYKDAIERALDELRGPDFPAAYIRKIFRRPDHAGIEFLNNVYFKRAATHSCIT